MYKKVAFTTLFIIIMCYTLALFGSILHYPIAVRNNIENILNNKGLNPKIVGISECSKEEYKFYLDFTINGEPTTRRFYSQDGKIVKEFKFELSKSTKDISANFMQLYKDGLCGQNLTFFRSKYGIIYKYLFWKNLFN